MNTNSFLTQNASQRWQRPGRLLIAGENWQMAGPLALTVFNCME